MRRGLRIRVRRCALSYLIEGYLDRYTEIVGRDLVGAGGVRALLNDSIEAGPKLWLLALAGAIVEDASKSDAFLYDADRVRSCVDASS